mgnify:CR=1 FL=1
MTLAWLAVAGCAGCVMTGAANGSQGGTGTSGSANVVIGTHVERAAPEPEKEKCRGDLEKGSVTYSVESLFAEVARDRAEMVQAFLACGMSAGVVGADDWTLLHEAAKNGSDRTVRLFLDVHADVNARTTPYRTTPLMSAAGNGHASTAGALLAGGAEVDAETTQGWTALTLAAQGDSVDTIRVLLAAHADVNHRDKEKKTPLLWYFNRPNMRAPEVLEALIAAGADVNAVPEDGQTALVALLSAWMGMLDKPEAAQMAKPRSEIACLLLRAGASPDLKNADGASANSLLKKLGFADAASFRGKGCALPAKMPKRAR